MRLTRAITAGAAVAGCLALSTGAAQAKDADAAATAALRVNYPITGTTYLAGTDSSMDLGPGVLESSVEADGALTANTKLPAATGSFKTLDLIPAKATTEFIETEPTKGTLNLSSGEVATTSKITLRITKLSIAGIPQLIGDHCQTEVPATIPLKSEPGFNVVNGGTLSGTYEIPKFEHCLLLTGVLNLIIPGPDNKISLKLAPGTIPAT